MEIHCARLSGDWQAFCSNEGCGARKTKILGADEMTIEKKSLISALKTTMKANAVKEDISGSSTSEKTPGFKSPGGKTPGGKTPGGKTPGGKTPGGKTPGGKTPGGKTPGGKTPGGKTPGNKNLASKW